MTFHAAMTGHLVYSTLHTNSALATIARLYDLGLKPYIIASALTGVLAQRLLRRTCDHCREPLPEEARARQAALIGGPFIGFERPVWRGRGCDHCNDTGYRGRVPIYEVLMINDALRRAIQTA